MVFSSIKCPALAIPGTGNLFIARLSPDGRKILYCTYLGGYRDAVGTLSINHDDSVYGAGSKI